MEFCPMNNSATWFRRTLLVRNLLSSAQTFVDAMFVMSPGQD